MFRHPLLARRLTFAVDWLSNRSGDLPIEACGASTGSAAALIAAADRPEKVPSPGDGRPALAQARLGDVQAPTLLIARGALGRWLSWREWFLRYLTGRG